MPDFQLAPETQPGHGSLVSALAERDSKFGCRARKLHLQYRLKHEEKSAAAALLSTRLKKKTQTEQTSQVLACLLNSLSKTVELKPHASAYSQQWEIKDLHFFQILKSNINRRLKRQELL